LIGWENVQNHYFPIALLWQIVLWGTDYITLLIHFYNFKIMYEPSNQQENSFLKFDPKSTKTKKKNESLSHGKANF